jgi:hypothetical protein
VLGYIESDKKRSGGNVRWVLAAATGVVIREDVPVPVVRSAVTAAIGTA